MQREDDGKDDEGSNGEADEHPDGDARHAHGTFCV